MKQERTQYRERSPWPGWVNALFWGSILVSCYPLLAGWGTDSPFGRRAAIAGGIVCFAVAMQVLMGGLAVLVQESRVYIHMGWVPVIRKVVPFSEIVSLESVRYSPLREFGGWGIRGFGKKRAWTASGDQAVVLTLTSGTLLYVGSPHPLRLEERIRTLAAGRMAEAPED